MATDNRDEIQQFLNRLSVLSPRSSPDDMLDPALLELAVARFVALQIYNVEGLGLLDTYNCTNVTITATLETDAFLQGTATISGNASDQSLNFQTGLFTFRPVNSNGTWVKNYGMASCGKLVIITHTNSMLTIDCDVIGYPEYRKKLKVKTYLPKNPSDSDSYDYEDEDQQA